MRKIVFLQCLLLLSTVLFAQDEKKPAFSLDELVVVNLPWILVGVAAFLVVVIIVLLIWIRQLVNYIPREGFDRKIAEERKGEPGPDFVTKVFKQMEAALTKAVPIEREKEIEFAHEYDGIRELDNSLPPWWKYLFYITIIFAVVYLYRYHISHSAPLSLEEYKEEIAQGEVQKAAYLEKAANMVNESSVVALSGSAELESGRKIFIDNCATCHGQLGEGIAGPNFTDEYWVHGGGIKNVFKTIKYGVPVKGMISWQTRLRPREMQEVASYILTLAGTNPPNAKPAEGEKYIPEAPTSTEANNEATAQ